MDRFLRAAKPDQSDTKRLDLPMRDLVSELVRPSTEELSPEVLVQRLGCHDEGACVHLVAAELGPLVYQRVQAHRAVLAPLVRARLEEQARLVTEHNAFLVDELEKISSACGAPKIPFLVIKGPTLANLTAGLYVRPFHDLDIVVQRHAFQDAAHALRSIGYAEVSTALRHEYHQIFARPEARGVSIVELHFDVGDRERAIAPDVAGIWRRSRMVPVAGYAVRAPDLTDHLLLTIMQLPHHGWSLRLLTDAGWVVSRRREQVEWDELAHRARAWGMWALTASTLYTLDVMFGVSLPEPLRSAVRPHNYFRRAQWHLVMDTVAARLAPEADPGGARMAPFLLLDRIEDIAALVARRVALAPRPPVPHAAAPPRARRVMERARSLPALARLLVRSISGEPEPGPRRPAGSVHRGQR